MYNKSLILQQVEKTEERAKFANDINSILEKYNIIDGVFGIINRSTYELSTGYFVETKQFDNIESVIKEMDQSHQAVRIVDGKFYLGDIYECLNDVPADSKPFNIEFLEFV